MIDLAVPVTIWKVGLGSEAPGHPHMDLAGVLPLVAPLRRQHPEVVVTPDQGVRGQEQRLAEAAVASKRPGGPRSGSTSSLSTAPRRTSRHGR